MSRCFPFPPPGYEKKTTNDDSDLLVKEKRKERKHKKDKKDKEKKEGKEKKDKERSKEKRKEKKERKEKHKDKKDKDKDRDKEKNKTLDDKKPDVQLQNFETNGTNVVANSTLQKIDAGDSKYVYELARRCRDEEKATGIPTTQNVVKVLDQRKGEVQGRMVENNNGYSSQMAKFKKENEDRKVVTGQRNSFMARGFEDSVEQELGTNHKKADVLPKPLEITDVARKAPLEITDIARKADIEKQMAGKEKSRHKESDHKSDRSKEKDREKKRKSREKDGDKIKKPEEKKLKEISEPSNEQPKIIEGGPRLKEMSVDNKVASLVKATNKTNSGACEEILGKRKEPEMNGYLHDNGNMASKRPNSFSHMVVENGRKLVPSQTAVHFTSESPHNSKVEVKSHKTNGFIEGQKLNNPLQKSQRKKVQASENGVKPPHPDSKYLDLILSVPKMDELPELEDQEWLFGSVRSEKKPKVVRGVGENTPTVWDRAIRIESADVVALPYVIPY